MATKSAAALRPIVREPSLLVFKEKCGDRYFHVPDDETLFKVALCVLTLRWKEGYWYYPASLEDRPETPDFTEEQIPSLPVSLQPAAVASIRAFKAAYRAWQNSADEYKRIETAVKEKDGRAAWQCLQDRRDGEYEGFRLEHYAKVPA